jgi:hypothetical protein
VCSQDVQTRGRDPSQPLGVPTSPPPGTPTGLTTRELTTVSTVAYALQHGLPLVTERSYGGAPGIDPHYVPTAHLFPEYAAKVIECAAADNFLDEAPYTALSIDEFSMLSFRNQLEEFRKLGMDFTTEQEFVSLLIPDDPQYPKTHTPYVLPVLPTALSLQETLRHISHLFF